MEGTEGHLPRPSPSEMGGIFMREGARITTALVTLGAFAWLLGGPALRSQVEGIVRDMPMIVSMREEQIGLRKALETKINEDTERWAARDLQAMDIVKALEKLTSTMAAVDQTVDIRLQNVKEQVVQINTLLDKVDSRLDSLSDRIRREERNPPIPGRSPR